MPEMALDGNTMKVLVDDIMLGDPVQLTPDILVLSVGIRPNEDNVELAKMCKVPLSKDKYFLEAHMKLRPVDFATSGIYLAGLAHWPKFIDESIAQASGAAARAMTVISRDLLETEAIISVIDEEKCTGCGSCIEICPFNAISKNEAGKAEVTVAACKGCGNCAASCPENAISMKHYSDEQLLAEAMAALEEVKI